MARLKKLAKKAVKKDIKKAVKGKTPKGMH